MVEGPPFQIPIRSYIIPFISVMWYVKFVTHTVATSLLTDILTIYDCNAIKNQIAHLNNYRTIYF